MSQVLNSNIVVSILISSGASAFSDASAFVRFSANASAWFGPFASAPVHFGAELRGIERFVVYRRIIHAKCILQ
jgi:hypothetical protein